MFKYQSFVRLAVQSLRSFMVFCLSRHEKNQSILYEIKNNIRRTSHTKQGTPRKPRFSLEFLEINRPIKGGTRAKTLYNNIRSGNISVCVIIMLVV